MQMGWYYILHVLIMTLELDHCHQIFIIFVQYGNLEQMFGPSLTERLAWGYIDCEYAVISGEGLAPESHHWEGGDGREEVIVIGAVFRDVRWAGTGVEDLTGGSDGGYEEFVCEAVRTTFAGTAGHICAKHSRSTREEVLVSQAVHRPVMRI